MRVANLLSTLLLPFSLLAQGTPTRFIEVQVIDSVRLPFQGMDLEVRMDNPTELAMAKASDLGDQDIDYDKLLHKAEAEAKSSEAEFIALMKTGGYTYRLSSTEHAQDYTGQTTKTFDVNNYLVELKAADMERYYKVTEGHIGWSGTPKQAHYGEAASSFPRLMKKLFDNARRKAEALISVTGGHVGKVISAQELARSEGSVLEQLFKMDKSSDKDETMLQFGSSESATMAFRFELLD